MIALLLGFTLLGHDAEPTDRSIEPPEVFAPASVPAGRVETAPEALGRVARDTARFLRAHPEDPASTGGLFASLGIDRSRTLQTLDFVAAQPGMMTDPAFLAEHFEVLRWTADKEGAKASKLDLDERIRLTKYLVYESPGASERSERYDTALYAVPEGGDLGRYSRQQIYAGAYETGGAAALAWLSRRDVNRALMQGTVRVRYADGRTAVFNVHKNNAIPYDRSITDSNKQGRYWYFREVAAVMGYGETDKIRLEADVAVAGDVYDLGLGRLFLLNEGGVSRLAVLADTGGAFQPNLYQLDWYSGAFVDHEAFLAGTKALPTRTAAYALVLKDGVSSAP